jgi:hypothetical protein
MTEDKAAPKTQTTLATGVSHESSTPTEAYRLHSRNAHAGRVARERRVQREERI